MRNDMMCEWVVGSFSGAQAKSVLEHAAAGVGYIILESNNNKLNQECTAAFRRAMDSPLPEHLIQVKDPIKINEYEKVRKAKQGLRDEINA